MEAQQSFGEIIRNLRKQKDVPLRVVAAAIEIDSTLLSKIERGERFPTEAQLLKFATYYQLPADTLNALLIADKIVAEYGTQAATLEAMQIVKERITLYDVKQGNNEDETEPTSL